MPGFENDLVTYVSMDAKTPNIRNFFIEDSNGERLHNPSEGAPFYQGPWNMTMYAGNQYHLIVEANLMRMVGEISTTLKSTLVLKIWSYIIH